MPLSNILIRPATIDDAAQIATLHVHSWKVTYADILPASMLEKLSVEKRTAGWQNILSSSHSAVHVVDKKGDIVGFASDNAQRNQTLLERGYTGEFASIYLHEDYQGRGLGKALMSCMAASLLAQGITLASLWVLSDNHPAREFYEHLGGRVIAEQADHRGDTVLHEVAYGWQDISILRH